MGETRFITSAQYEEMCRLLDRARELREQARGPGLSLKAKLALQRQARELRAQAMGMEAFRD